MTPIISLMTYNLRYDTPSDGQNSWIHRKEAVADLIQTQSVDLLGVQEALYHQITDLHQAFPHMNWVGVGRDDGQKRGEFMAIFYARARFNLLEQGHFWLSETPEVAGSKSWNSACPRMVTWVRLQDKHTQRIFYYFNTHLDHQSQQARAESAQLLNQKIEAIAGQTLALLTGDFNLTPKEAEYTTLTSYFTDLRDKFPEKKFINTTFNGFGQQGISGMMIDFIFAHLARYVKAHSFDILDIKYNQRFPTDHFPLVLRFEIVD